MNYYAYHVFLTVLLTGKLTMIVKKPEGVVFHSNCRHSTSDHELESSYH